MYLLTKTKLLQIAARFFLSMTYKNIGLNRGKLLA